MLVTLKNAEEGNSFFGNSDFKFYDLGGKELKFDSLLVDKKQTLSYPIPAAFDYCFRGSCDLIYLFNKSQKCKTENKEGDSPKKIL